MVKLSALDQSPIRPGATAQMAMQETLALAKRCDELGYERYWVAEHHNTQSFAGSSPEILITRIANETKNIRVGSGGVMLPHYSPLKVAENFRVLETMYPGRIDLGLGRATGADPKTGAALQSGPQSYDIGVYPQLVDLVRRYLRDAKGEEGFAEEHPFKGIRAAPFGPGMPEMWLLGSSFDSAVHAGQMGLAFSFAHFISGNMCKAMLAQYFENFEPSAEVPEPKASIGINVLLAPTQEEADDLISTTRLWALRMQKGQHGPFPSLEEAKSYPYNSVDEAQLAQMGGRSFVGTADVIVPQLKEFAADHNVDELVVLTITHDFEARVRSYELLAETMGI